jgi:hypothetical protein
VDILLSTHGADLDPPAFPNCDADSIASEESPAVVGGIGGDFADVEPAKPMQKAVELLPEGIPAEW